VLPLLLGIVGLAVVAALVLAGANIRRHTHMGRPWKQRLVSAGLLLLGSIGAGIVGCKKSSPPASQTTVEVPATPAATHPAAKAPLPSFVQPKVRAQLGGPFQDIEAIVGEAKKIATAQTKGPEFDRAAKERLLKRLKKAQDQLDRLQAAGQINLAAAGLWKLDIKPP